MVLVKLDAGGKQGLGYTYSDAATATLIQKKLAKLIEGHDAMSPQSLYMRMWHETRNLGRPGIVSSAISAVDCAVWDLKA